MNPDPNTWTHQAVGSRNFNVVDPDGNPLVGSDGEPVRFRTAAEAKAEIAAAADDFDAEQHSEQRHTIDNRGIVVCENTWPTPPETVDSDDDIASMDRATRLAKASAESKAVAAWRTSGETDPCTRPATPVLDWMADPTTSPKRQPKGTASVRSAEDDARLERIVNESREAGLGWWDTARALNEAGIPTGRGAPWRDTTAWMVGKRLGLTGTRKSA